MGKGLFGRLQNEVNAREKTPGITIADILDLPDSLRDLINWMMREVEVSLPELAAHLGKDEPSARAMLATLLDKGFVREIEMKGKLTYRVRLAPKRKITMPANLWKALDDKIDE